MIARALRGLVAATVLVAATSTAAQSQGFGASAGVALPTGDFGEGAKLGFHIGGQYEMPLQNALGLRFNIDYGRYGLDGIDGSTSLLGGIANVTYNIDLGGSGLKPYVFGGLGFYNTTVDIDGLGSLDDSNIAFNFGAGYNFAMSGRNLFAEVRYLSIRGDGGSLNTLPIVVGIRF